MKHSLTRPTIDWQALETSYVNGYTSYEDFATAHGIHPPTLRKRAERGGWTAKRHELAQTVTAQAQEKLTMSRVDELSAFNCESLTLAKAIQARASKDLGVRRI